MKQLATSTAADPSLSVQMENQNRLAMEAGTAAFELNYPFVYPAMKADNPKLFKDFKWALYPEVIPGVPAKVTIGGIDLAVSAYSQHKDARLPGRAVPARRAEPAHRRQRRRRAADDRQPVQQPGAVRRLPVPRRHPAGARERERAAEDARSTRSCPSTSRTWSRRRPASARPAREQSMVGQINNALQSKGLVP